MRIRDSIHGTLHLSDAEVPILDSRLFQRLRHIRQLGFGEMAFPGATHSRHAHCLGAMHVASRLFDAVFARVSLPDAERARLRQAVRLAVLCHDLGHMPLSHASERIAPVRRALGLPAWLPGDPGERVSHEDVTAKLLLDSSLTPLLARSLQGSGLGPEAIAALIVGQDPPGGAPFVASNTGACLRPAAAPAASASGKFSPDTTKTVPTCPLCAALLMATAVA